MATAAPVKFIDLFCGIGGFRYAFEEALAERGLAPQCAFSSDIDAHCRKAYAENFGEPPTGDIRAVDAKDIPDHDVLLAGFPCQPFSIFGRGEGFKDSTRGTLFFEIARILEAKKPFGFVLENVKTLRTHDGGRTLATILKTLKSLGYGNADYRIFDARDFGLPQRRGRIWIVGTRDGACRKIKWPKGGIPMKPLEEILEKNPPRKFYASDKIRASRKASMTAKGLKGLRPGQASIWHENKAGNISAHPYSCALRAGSSYNYLLVNGERRLTPREMLRLQGFPDGFKQICSDFQTRKQAGNSLPVNVAKAVAGALLDAAMESKEFPASALPEETKA